MAQVFEVQYRINVQHEAALQAIGQFQEATTQLAHMSRRFDTVTKSIGKLNSAFKSIQTKPINITVNLQTKKAKESLREITDSVKALGGLSKLNMTVPDISKFADDITKVKNAATKLNNSDIKITANTGKAIESLDALLKKIEAVLAKKKIVITATAAGASSAIDTKDSDSKSKGKSKKNKTPQTPAASPSFNAGSSRASNFSMIGDIHANSGTNIVGEAFKGVGVAYGLSSFMSGIEGVFKDAVEYENISQTTKNILGSHDKSANFESNFEQMNKIMREVGVETKFTATEVASAGKFLAMAGLGINDIKQAMRPIANLALIGDTDLGETADVTTNIMTGYEIPSNKMKDVADILTMTFTKSNVTLMELAESFKYAGTVARSAGLDVEQAAAAFGVMGDAGIKASSAGTMLRMMLVNMQKPTKNQKEAWKKLQISPKDANGNLKDFNELMLALNKKSKEMSSGEFNSLFYQAFRVTAATGALALVRHADKLQEVTELNKQSYGLSDELGEAKKNTIEGLWYQMTSAFTESGMQGFEAMQGAIRDFLQRMIKLMKSPDFVEALSSAMQIFMKLTEMVVDMFNSFMKAWNAIPDWAKTGIVQFARLQLIFSIMTGSAKTILATFLSVKKVFSGNWLSTFKNLWLSFQRRRYMPGELRRNQAEAMEFKERLLDRYRAMRDENYKPGTRHPYSNSQANKAVKQHLQRANARTLARWGVPAASNAAVSAATNTIAAGAGAAGAGAGSAMSNVIKPITKFVTTHPIAIGVTAIVGALSSLALYIYNIYQTTQDAISANERWSESYRKLGVDQLDATDPNSRVIANIRITTSEIKSQSEKLKILGEQWHQYWIEKNGGVSNNAKTDNANKAADKDDTFRNNLKVADSWFSFGAKSDLEERMKQLGGYYYTKHNDFVMPGGFKIFLKDGNLSETALVQMALYQYGANQNHPDKLKVESFLSKYAHQADSYGDMVNILNSQINPILDRKKSALTSQYISAEKALEMSEFDVNRTAAVTYALSESMLKVKESYENMLNLWKDIDDKKNIDALRAQEVLSEHVSSILFDRKYGLFGTDSWFQNVSKIYENPTAFGLNRNASVAEITGLINQSFDDLIEFYNGLDNKYKPFFAQFLNRSLFSKLLPEGQTLNSGGWEGGNQVGDVMTGGDGKKYTWKQLVTPDNKTYHAWMSKDGSIYTPKDAKETKTWEPSNNGKSPNNSVHNGSDQSQYKSHYNQSSAPKQVIVKIENLMRVDNQTIDMTDDRQVAALNNVKQELATVLLDVVQDFNSNIV